MDFSKLILEYLGNKNIGISQLQNLIEKLEITLSARIQNIQTISYFVW